MVRVEGLRKAFFHRRKIVLAVDNLTFRAAPGRIYGLLGPHVAGKTTALRCIATLLRPDAGSITVNDVDAGADPRSVRSRIGFLSSDMALPRYLTPRELLHFFGELHHLERPDITRRTDELSEYLAGDLVRTLDSQRRGTVFWNMISRNGQDITSGVYLYAVTCGDETKVGRFTVIR